MSKDEYYETADGFKAWCLQTLHYFKLATGFAMAVVYAACFLYTMAVGFGGRP